MFDMFFLVPTMWFTHKYSVSKYNNTFLTIFQLVDEQIIDELIVISRCTNIILEIYELYDS